ncbi:methyltransferase domain-containing protein [Aestuariivita sp.]|jgi:SAM-dependent methyltransferase|uniref:class I SAM-dependent methyltransferase n=1 Tax=Aestuariivita sp. TaxID=1872407 RepID=UPI00216C7FF1|nr:methyltransferase domain-containing protein [Aestuariivita sp.]MCE8008485.1 class I SAM-dependent methyltransferase [Aestuariivita sp.]
MHLDVQDLRNFYYRSTLGRAAQGILQSRLVEMWPDVKGQTVAGFGFAVPLLRPFLADARRVMALMPGPQGVMRWPANLPNVSVLMEETAWPIETGHVDRLVVMHGLETSEQPSLVLDECRRALGPGGKAVFIVPNRAGLWSRSDKTPFGFGRPYTLGQVENQLRKHHFAIERHMSVLYQVPSTRRFWMKSGPLMERMGQRIPTILAGGVFVIEVSKHVHDRRGTPVGREVSRPMEVLEGLSKPVAKPV